LCCFQFGAGNKFIAPAIADGKAFIATTKTLPWYSVRCPDRGDQGAVEKEMSNVDAREKSDSR
jgi:hypothetical protein